MIDPFKCGLVGDAEFVDAHCRCSGDDLDEIAACAGEDSVLVVLGDLAEVLDQERWIALVGEGLRDAGDSIGS